MFSPKTGKKARISALVIPIQYHTGGLSWCNKVRNSNKKHRNWKGRNKTVSTYIRNDSLHRKSQRIYKRNPRISEFCKVEEYKVKSIVFLYISNKQLEIDIS